MNSTPRLSHCLPVRFLVCILIVCCCANISLAQRPDSGSPNAESSEEGRRDRGQRGGDRRGRGGGEGESARGQRGGGGERSGGRSRTETPPVLDSEFIKTKLPSGTEYISDVVFKEVDGLDLKLDLLLPKNEAKSPLPTAIWIHGGAWMRGNKARDLHRFDQLTSRILSEGMAFVSIEYRLSGQAAFPGPVVDCSDAIAFLNRNREKYGLDTDRMIILGTSAGGHLASLIGTSLTSDASDFVTDESQPMGKILGVVDFYGPIDLVMLQTKRGEIDFENDMSPEARFLGHSPLMRPDLAQAASPITYVTKNSPPFLIFHGDLDARVPMMQSIYLNSMLKAHGVESRLVEVEGARHGDEKFDDATYNNDAIEFIRSLIH
ncbi:alpha/beta hydrolase [Rhodopirellula bahusiensis]|uniref:alpha/beta hydrolase n=1 Tax=Rhodopirellula bahusiensis TaxID=2014065 RepID=UPI001E487547|nr:alpha/beta hydrolase [Rhodopirellula bahusiensis]